MGTAFEFSMGTIFSFHDDYVYATHKMPSRENGKFDDAKSIPSRKILTIIENVYATGPRGPLHKAISRPRIFVGHRESGIPDKNRDYPLHKSRSQSLSKEMS